MSQDSNSSSLKLDAIDKLGNPRQVLLRATIISANTKAAIQKQDGSPQIEGNIPATSVSEDPFKNLQSIGKIIDPPYSLDKLAALVENSSELNDCINTMVTNTTGFGWALRERPMPEGLREKFSEDIAAEKAMLASFLETVHPTKSFDQLCCEAKKDQHTCGNGYLELIHNKNEELVGMNHIHGHLVRMSKLSGQPVKVNVPRVRPDQDFRIEDVPMLHYFRSYAMIRTGTSKVVWFKEAGDPRIMNRETGEYDENTKFGKRASSLLHFSIYSALSPYGIPNWVGNMFSILGTKKSEEVNFNTLSSNAIPSMFVVVENGALTEGSIQRLKEWTEEQVQKSLNYSKFMLLEGEALEEGAPTGSNFKIRVIPLRRMQSEDELFQKYAANNRDKVRQSFRLPPIFVGSTADYNRATSDTAKQLADEQVFAPERSVDDFKKTRFILMPWKARFHTFRANHPNITDDAQMIALMNMAERSGAMTPRRADRIVRDVFGDDVGPLPKNIDLDKPFSITYAEAAKGSQPGSNEPAGNYDTSASVTASKMIEGLVDLRQRLEKELDKRAA